MPEIVEAKTMAIWNLDDLFGCWPKVVLAISKVSNRAKACIRLMTSQACCGVTRIASYPVPVELKIDGRSPERG